MKTIYAMGCLVGWPNYYCPVCGKQVLYITQLRDSRVYEHPISFSCDRSKQLYKVPGESITAEVLNAKTTGTDISPVLGNSG